MTDEMMIERVKGALGMVMRDKISSQKFALYVRKVTDTFLTEVDDSTLPSRLGELGEAPVSWGVDADFNDSDAMQLSGGDDMDAPDDYPID